MNEEALSFERDLYTDLANALPSGIYRIRVFRDESLIEDNWLLSIVAPYSVEFANDRFFEILHLDRHVYNTNPSVLHDLIYEADKAEFAKQNVESNMHKLPFKWEGRLVIDKQIVWVSFKSIPRIMRNGDVIWTGTLDDITERKQTEEQIILKNVELLQLNANKDYFLSILAHDLKSPFNSILGFLDLLINNLRNFHLNEIERQLSIVNHSAQSVYNLLEDLLLWARSQSDKLPYNPELFNFKNSCEAVIELVKPNADNKNISINAVIIEKIDVFADRNMLNTILRNLLSNAIKFTNNGGEINVFAQQDSAHVTISVSDNGIGIPPQMLSHLFDITQVPSTKGTANETGTGLGIILCKEFVEKHGGKIWVESQLNKGTSFHFTLPNLALDATTK